MTVFPVNLTRPLLMGIVNATPDSFSDGGDKEKALEKALRLSDEGADIIDLGGESTRPGAPELPVEEELHRVLPVLKELKRLRPSVFVSVDTRKDAVAHAVLDLGAKMINDVSGLEFSPAIAPLVAQYGAMLVLMHTRGTPETMQSQCVYADLTGEIRSVLSSAMRRAVEAGVPEKNILVDPGLGFGKDMEQNFEILRQIEVFKSVAPVLIGHSRKSFLRTFNQESDPKQVLPAVLAASHFAAQKGAAVLRVHDVAAHLQFFATWRKCLNE